MKGCLHCSIDVEEMFISLYIYPKYEWEFSEAILPFKPFKPINCFGHRANTIMVF
jgi:hypothetical protein